MEIKITLGLDNAAFENNEGPETARILRQIASRLDRQDIIGKYYSPIFDVNGNHVGHFDVYPNEE